MAHGSDEIFSRIERIAIRLLMLFLLLVAIWKIARLEIRDLKNDQKSAISTLRLAVEAATGCAAVVRCKLQ
jgi:hypothetical protein